MNGVPVPPASLRERVHGSPVLQTYMAVGERCSEDLLAALLRAGIECGSATVMLDFGCGAGRTMRWLLRRRPHPELHGTDVDARAIAWCRRHLPGASFRVNEAMPPLEYSTQQFDVVYAVSVFSHLDEPRQDAWLAELCRITTRGGHVVVTVHGPAAIPSLPEAAAAKLERDGFAWVPLKSPYRAFPPSYGTAVHTQRYVQDHFSRHFEVVEHKERGLNDHQDLVVLRVP